MRNWFSNFGDRPMNTINNYSLPAALLLLTATTPLCAAEFSEDNWIGINGHPGVNDSVSATAVDASGNLYVAGGFTVAGDVSVTNIVKWDGSRWSALGSGMDYGVGLLAASGDELFAAGSYTT